ncbi:MAG: hypothetical protein Q8941_08525 [Bacteroidota bacterium]|nr:hypothetical protein [Bacteroidota bacterium]
MDTQQDQNDLPKTFPVTSVKMDRIRFEEGAAMISNVRIAIGAPDMRNKLLTEGKLVSYGIYFDVNKAAVKNELTKLFDIDAARIETNGKGESQSMTLNDTASNKALNRKVEFIKLESGHRYKTGRKRVRAQASHLFDRAPVINEISLMKTTNTHQYGYTLLRELDIFKVLKFYI